MKILYLALPFTALVAASASAARPVYDSQAPIAYMLDLSSGAVLFARDADRRIPPASMAKMMTVYVAFDQLAKGKTKADQKVAINPGTWKAWQGQGSTMFLMPDDKPTIADLLHGVITLSGNDASVVLADAIAGNEASFAYLMNASAKKIGLKNSHFGNATGWPDEGRTYVTARDLAQLGARLALDFPELYKQYFGLREFSWGKTNNGAAITQPNRNPLFGKVDGADGLKTGHTEEAGYGFAGSAEQKGRRLIAVVAGLDSYNARISESVTFMNWGFAAWETKPLFKKGTKLQNAEVQGGDTSSVGLLAPRDLSATLPIGASDKLTMKVRYVGPVKAPFAKGATLAELVVSTPTGDQVMSLVAAEAVGPAGFFDRVWAGLKSLIGWG